MSATPGLPIDTDPDGYLKNLKDWSPSIASILAEQEGITLADEHWLVITALQTFYRKFEVSPAMRPLVKYIGLELGKDKGNSIYLMTLFPPSPARVASKIAGLPRPDNCL
jgi:tRNA 2-thiouridine synthesizing protein E|tara:strand:- start:649 stop:978 length:330 start_codon:yes stop_codon:yes gene_type:complete